MKRINNYYSKVLHYFIYNFLYLNEYLHLPLFSNSFPLSSYESVYPVSFIRVTIIPEREGQRDWWKIDRTNPKLTLRQDVKLRVFYEHEIRKYHGGRWARYDVWLKYNLEILDIDYSEFVSYLRDDCYTTIPKTEHGNRPPNVTLSFPHDALDKVRFFNKFYKFRFWGKSKKYVINK